MQNEAQKKSFAPATFKESISDVSVVIPPPETLALIQNDS